MLTIFAVPKPFEGHIGVIQRNAVGSWKHLDPECQVILCGDEAGCRDVASELGTDEIRDVERNEFGTPLLSSVFQRAEERAEHDLLCYANADLILFTDLLVATSRLAARYERFLIVGAATNLEVGGRLQFDDAETEVELRRRAATAGVLRGPTWIDFFVFPRGTVGSLPAFAVGRPAWDNWMIWRGRSLRIPVIDVSATALVIHQEHAYGHVEQNRGSRWDGPEGDRNRQLLQFDERAFSLDDVSHRLLPVRLVRNRTGGVKRRLRNQLSLSPRTIPLYRALRRAHRPLRRFSSQR
jgi:hypothetical protein